MLNELCDTCGDHESFHLGTHAETAASLFMMERAIEMLPAEYGEVLRNILTDWRTHSLPTCNPLSLN